jgi:hypothetical protein
MHFKCILTHHNLLTGQSTHDVGPACVSILGVESVKTERIKILSVALHEHFLRLHARAKMQGDFLNKRGACWAVRPHVHMLSFVTLPGVAKPRVSCSALQNPALSGFGNCSPAEICGCKHDDHAHESQ